MQERLVFPPRDHAIEETCVDPAPPTRLVKTGFRPIDLILLGSIVGTAVAAIWIGICIGAANG